MELLTVAAAVAGILAFAYILIIGQKSIPEWWRERNAEKRNHNKQNQSVPLAAATLRTIPHNLPHRSDFVGREKERGRNSDSRRFDNIRRAWGFTRDHVGFA